MDLRFMWYATTTVINTILPKYHRFDDEYEIILKEEDIRDKYMRYVVSVGDRTFHYVYTFFSNVCVSGSLEITDTQTGNVYTYAVERNNDSVRLYSDLENYGEILLQQKHVDRYSDQQLSKELYRCCNYRSSQRTCISSHDHKNHR